MGKKNFSLFLSGERLNYQIIQFLQKEILFVSLNESHIQKHTANLPARKDSNPKVFILVTHQMETHILKIRSVPVIILQLHFLFSSFKIKPRKLTSQSAFTDVILKKGRPFHSQMKRYQIDKEMPQGQQSQKYEYM